MLKLHPTEILRNHGRHMIFHLLVITACEVRNHTIHYAIFVKQNPIYYYI
jgi:hypothetical protein